MSENVDQMMRSSGFSTRARSFWTNHKETLIDVSVAFVVSRVIFYSAAILALLTIPEHPGNGYEPYNSPTHALFDASIRWDAGWYLHIAREGYDWTSPDEESSVAFFPLFPLILRGLIALASEPGIYPVAIIFNHLLYFLALIPVWHYASHFGGRDIARRTVLLISIFPTAFFFNALYTEALFLLVSACSLLAIQRRAWGYAGLAGALASLTRPTGVFLTIPYLIQVWRESHDGLLRTALRSWPIIFIPGGLFLYMSYLAIEFGEPFAFVRVQEAWGHVQMLPTTAIWESIRFLTDAEVRDIFFVMGSVNTIVTLWALAMTAIIARTDWPGASFAITAILTPLVAGVEDMPVVSMGRYMVVLFPLFIPMARWAGNTSILALMIAAFLPTHVMLAALFVRWYWVV